MTHVEEASTPWCIRELQLSSGKVCRRTAAVLRNKATIDAVEMSNLVWLRECEGPDTMPHMGALCESRDKNGATLLVERRERTTEAL